MDVQLGGGPGAGVPDLARALRDLLSGSAPPEPVQTRPVPGEGDGRDGAATALSLASGLVDLIGATTSGSAEVDERASALITATREARRPSWTAAVRAVWARDLWRRGHEHHALDQLVLAELDLDEEVRSPADVMDPVGGPTGPAAAANNLGGAYTAMRLFELAEAHLWAAFEWSSRSYGPHLRLQACIDESNLAEVQLRWAFHEVSIGRSDEAARRARSAADVAASARTSARDVGWHELVRLLDVFEVGGRAIADAPSIVAGDLELVDEALVRGVVDGATGRLLSYAVRSRVLRLLGRDAEVAAVAESARALAASGDPTAVMAVMHEAALAAGPAPLGVWVYAEGLARELEESRRRTVEEFRSRLSFEALSREHEQVSAERHRLRAALDASAAEEAALLHAATHDPLTDLPNRALLHERLGLALSRAVTAGRPVAVAFLDLDDFKRVNDDHGHAVGDEVLRRTADRLRARVRQQDTVARLGGDEFVVVLAAPRSPEQALRWAERIGAELAAASPDGVPATSASIGVHLVVEAEGVDADGALELADRAMYEAKRGGKGAAVVVQTPASPPH